MICEMQFGQRGGRRKDLFGYPRREVEEKIIEVDAAQRELEAARKLSCDYAERIAVLKDRNSRLEKERCYLLVVVMGCVFVMFALVLVRRNVG